MFSSKNKAIRKPLQGLPAHYNKSSWSWFNFNPFIAMGNFKFRRKCSNINLKKNWNWMNCSRQCFTNSELRNYDRSETSELNFGIGETVCSHGHLYTGQLSRHFLFWQVTNLRPVTLDPNYNPGVDFLDHDFLYS